MSKEFRQCEWDAATEDDCRQIIRLAVREDLDRMQDWTTVSLVPSTASALANVVARQHGVICGLRASQLVSAEFDPSVQWSASVDDGQMVEAGLKLATLSGPARSVLTMERTLLNFIGRLSGVATLTHQYVQAVQGTKARIYDTRKTAPGWRRLEKYAVRSGGGHNHRTGLFDAILIKDNHLALGAAAAGDNRVTPFQAVVRAREFIKNLAAKNGTSEIPLEVEVETLEQLAQVLPAGPDIVLLDNMSLDMLRRAVAIRDRQAPGIELEASGGVNLHSVGAIAATGVERISAGSLTHSAAVLDVALDWQV